MRRGLGRILMVASLVAGVMAAHPRAEIVAFVDLVAPLRGTWRLDPHPGHPHLGISTDPIRTNGGSLRLSVLFWWGGPATWRVDSRGRILSPLHFAQTRSSMTDDRGFSVHSDLTAFRERSAQEGPFIGRWVRAKDGRVHWAMQAAGSTDVHEILLAQDPTKPLMPSPSHRVPDAGNKPEVIDRWPLASGAVAYGIVVDASPSRIVLRMIPFPDDAHSFGMTYYGPEQQAPLLEYVRIDG